MPNLDFDYSREKGAYTRFFFTGDKAVFVLTSPGGFSSVGAGYFRGVYHVCDFKTGKLESRQMANHLPGTLRSRPSRL
ncbi:MAG: hypothetical protein QNK37_31800 [Acidobacteriota bacterium]|nr:hypothetical protein [Acidobacteriota bacterium]